MVLVALLRSLLVVALPLASSSAASEHTCPAYADLAEASVAADRFDMSMLQGIDWLMVATTEPTIPTFCECTLLRYSVHENGASPGGWYNYSANTSCGIAGYHVRIAAPLMGVLSDDPHTPGLLHETFGLFNHTLGPPDPNYVFRVEYSRTGGQIVAFHTYACLGSLFGTPLFSYNFLVRREFAVAYNLDREHVLEQVKAANAKGLMALEGIRIEDHSAWEECGILSSSAPPGQIGVPVFTV
mmetsp:Transcript_28688/g.52246  ORF Transcript_28688/g.52246 Transcript_28688/m.52246 type:complete len:242 (+) Transcript_28688:72-797(+)